MFSKGLRKISNLIVFFTLFTKNKKYIFSGSLMEFFKICRHYKKVNIANFVLTVPLKLTRPTKSATLRFKPVMPVMPADI